MMPPVAYHPADGEMVRRILAETGVATKPAGPPLTAYVGAWIEAVMRWVAGFFKERPLLERSDAAVPRPHRR